jgi:phosphoribosylformylglycinamidine synthase
VLRLPAVASKNFLITIGDRSVGGLTARDQMVGPWQVPVADVAVTAMGYDTVRGEASPWASARRWRCSTPPASGRMAVGEAITNLAAADVGDIGAHQALGQLDGGRRPPGRGRGAVRHGEGRRHGALPGARRRDSGRQGFAVDAHQALEDSRAPQKQVTAPLSLIVTAFAAVDDVRRTLTPQLRPDAEVGETELLLIDLGQGRNRLGGSALAQVREQGVNGQVEMAAAFDRAGFDAIDLHMSQLIAGETTLADFKGLVACGGFSYGDVLGAGQGWARSILYNVRAREQFAAFFARVDSFSLGVCNGCQMMSGLKSLIPGADHWPRFLRNRSEQFEARLVLVRVEASPSILLRDMAGSILPITVAHGEGRAVFSDDGMQQASESAKTVALRYVDHDQRVTERYPFNPNGSPAGITALTSIDGRATIMMPHPERLFRVSQHSWFPSRDGEAAPWLRMFQNARAWVA